MRRRMLAVLVSVLLAIVVPGCGEDDEAGSTPTPTAGQGGILDQPGRARDTVDGLNEGQRERGG